MNASADPLAPLRAAFTYDQVLETCDRYADAPGNAIGLCWYFSHVDGRDKFFEPERSRAYDDLPRVLDALGGERPRNGSFYWPHYRPLDGTEGAPFDDRECAIVSDVAYNQRMTMLAFMLTWLEDDE